MTSAIDGPTDNRFWWVSHDYATYKVPEPDGNVLIPQKFLAPGFTPDPPRLRYSYDHSRRDGRKVADFAGWENSAFFVNDQAFAVFQDMFAKHGRAFSVLCDGKPHHLVLIDRLEDAFDAGCSRFKRFGFSERAEEDISQMLRVVLRQDFSTDADIFRLADGYKLGLNMIVSEAFRRRYESAGLTGLFFWATDGSETRFPPASQ